MVETLLTPSSVKLFGRVVKSLGFTNDTTSFGGNYFLQRQLAVDTSIDFVGDTVGYLPAFPGIPAQGANPAVPPTPDNSSVSSIITNIDPLKVVKITPGMTVADTSGAIPNNTVVLAIGKNSVLISQPAIKDTSKTKFVATLVPVFARIYGFAFEGTYYPLSRPSIYLVHGIGQPVGNWANPSALDQTGVMAREWDFSGYNLPNDLAFWEYEKGDFSIRVDLESGPLDQILLQMALRGGPDRTDRSGQGLDVRSGQGLDVRSGQGLRNGR